MGKRRTISFSSGPLYGSTRRRLSYGGRSNFTSAASFYPRMSYGSALASSYSPTMTTSSTNYGSGGGVTSQFDRKTVYRHRRMPRYKRRRWLKFVKKVRATNLKLLGTRTIIRNDTLTLTNNSEFQEVGFASIYGKDGPLADGSQCGSNDLSAIMNNDLTVQATSRLQFGSAILDLTMSNLSTVVTDGGVQNTGLEVDIYDLVYRKNADAATPVALFLAADSATPQINPAKFGLNLAFRGATPFDLPEALSRAGIKILKKTKVFLGEGECATYQIRDPRNRSFMSSSIDDGDNNYIYPKSTRTIMFIMKGVPTNDATKVTKKLVIGATRKYMYKIQQNNSNADNYLP